MRVEASDNLEQWRVVVPSATLVRLESQGASLERASVTLPEARYRYLRLVRAGEGPPPVVEAVVAEAVQHVASAGPTPRWFQAASLLQPDGASFDFDAGRRAPVERARIGLSGRNQVANLELQSRADGKAPWTTRWRGERFRYEREGEVRTSEDIVFARTADPFWRVHVVEGREGFDDASPSLELAYMPDTLRFLTQGQGPFLLAYGSARAPTAEPRPCEWLRQALAPDPAGAMVGIARVGSEQSLGGEAMRHPAVPPPPWRRYVLWAALVAGAGLVVWMALGLVRDATRRGGPGPEQG